jgi:hypothetical protein
VPASVAPPLPPRKPCQSGQTWPATAPAAQQAASQSRAIAGSGATPDIASAGSQPRREPALADIDDDCPRGEAEALGAQRVRAARIAAAQGADVDTQEMPDEKRAHDRAHQVSDQRLEAEFQQSL